MGYHIYAIGKAIRALFADRVTNDNELAALNLETFLVNIIMHM